MKNLPQTHKRSRSVRVREDIWQAARAKSFHTNETITETLDRVLRKQFKLPTEERAA